MLDSAVSWQCTEPLSSWVGIEAVHAVVWHSNTDIPAEWRSFDRFGKFTVNRFVLLYNVFTTDMDLVDLRFVWHLLTIAILKLKPITIWWKYPRFMIDLVLWYNFFYKDLSQLFFMIVSHSIGIGKYGTKQIPNDYVPSRKKMWYGRVKYVATLLKVTSEQSYVFYDIWNGTAVQNKWLGSLLSVELIIIPTSNWLQ